MMRTIALTLALAAAVCSQSLISAEKRTNQRSSTKDSLQPADNKPDLAIEYARVSKIKLASRKRTYKLGEMISLDVALLNTSTVPTFFHRFLQPNFYVKNPPAQFKPVLPYVLIEAPASLDSYVLLQPGEITASYFELLAGCDKRASDNISESKDSRKRFEENRFVNWGDLCLNVDRRGLYDIVVEQGNNDVVVQENTSNVKTAVGTTRSDAFTIEIVK